MTVKKKKKKPTLTCGDDNSIKVNLIAVNSRSRGQRDEDTDHSRTFDVECKEAPSTTLPIHQKSIDLIRLISKFREIVFNTI